MDRSSGLGVSVLLRQPQVFEGVLLALVHDIRSIAPLRIVHTKVARATTSIPPRPFRCWVPGTTTRSPASMNSWGSSRADSQVSRNSPMIRRI